MQPYQSRRVSLPPPPPLEPRYADPQHLLHAILTFFSLGLWLPIWLLCIWSNNRANEGARRRYEQQHLAWRQAYWAWQHQA